MVPRCKGDKDRGQNQNPGQKWKRVASGTRMQWDWSFTRERVYILKRNKTTGTDTGRIMDFVAGG